MVTKSSMFCLQCCLFFTKNFTNVFSMSINKKGQKNLKPIEHLMALRTV